MKLIEEPKVCAMCGQRFNPTHRNQKHCKECRAKKRMSYFENKGVKERG